MTALLRLSLLLLTALLFSLLSTPTLAVKKSYVVYLGAHSHASRPSSADLDRVTESHYDFLGSFLGDREKAKDAIFYSYTKHINGFAATLEEEEAAEIAKHPSVVSVFLNKAKKLHTTHSWSFLGLERDGAIPSQSIWTKARLGEDTIIANLDTGVWPESASFRDEGMGPVPSKWKGICDSSGGVRCNRKLIGASYFVKGFEADNGPQNATTFHTARDQGGHGSHTLSTLGGNFVFGANVFGYGNGTAKGGSPRARVAAYRVCFPPTPTGGECYDADTMAGFDAAIHDGVDVLSVSLGGDPIDYYNDGIAIGAFHAVANGIVVVCSAGNSGPAEGTVSNIAPWMVTVGASSMDREFGSYIELGNKKHIKGQSLSASGLTKEFYPLINSVDARASNASAEDAKLCQHGTLDPKKVKGKILVCLRGKNPRVDKGEQALLVGAVGMVLCNDEADGNDLMADPHILPATHITYTDGQAVYAYLNSTKNPIAHLSNVKTNLGLRPAPYIAAFSSKGPNKITPEILKPDITAVGKNVIAAYAESVSPTEEPSDKRRIPYITMSGTSMSCPHVSGVAGLLKTLHPDWSPAAIRSAIMTSARTRNNEELPITTASLVEATPLDYGAGHLRPNRAMDPGLVYDLKTDDYLNFLCALGYNKTLLGYFSDNPYKCPESASVLNLNYPSITVPELSGSITVTRTLKNVGSPDTYAARVQAPPRISVSVEPDTLKFDEIGEEKSFKITLKAKHANAARDYVFGHLVWSDGKHYVRSPIVVKTAQY